MAPQHAESRIADRVPLQIHRLQPRIRQGGGIVRLLCQTQAVGVELHQAKAALPHQIENPGQIVPYRGFTAGDLDIAGAGGPFQGIQPLTDVCQRRVGGGTGRTR